MGKEKAALPYQPYQGFNINSMASSSQQQQCIKRNSTYSPPTRSQSMYIQKSGLDEPEILKRRVCSTRGGRSRKSTLFSSRSIPKIPQIENSVDLFEKVINALRNCAENLKDNIHSSPITAKRNLEHKLRWCEERLSQIDGLYEFYKHEIKMRRGARNLETALLSYGVKHGQDKCKSNYKESTQNMCEIEDEFERRMGRFKVKMDALDGFARLCPGDNFEIYIRNGNGRKWKARCKIEREGQKWTDNDVEIKGSVKDGLFLRIIEVKKIQANSQLGSFSVRLRNYITARPMNLSIPVNKAGNLKLRVTIHWQPLSVKEELKIKKTSREGLLSEVFFGSAVNISHEERPRISIETPESFSPSSPSAVSSTPSTSSNPSFHFDKVMYDDHRGDQDNSSTSTEKINEDNPEQEFSEETGEITVAYEELDMETSSTKPSTLDQLLRKLQSVLTQHKEQHPQLQQLHEKLEKLDAILQGGKLRRGNLSGSVESALESFSFLDITEVGIKPDKELRPFDTGYSSSTEETQKLEHSQMNGGDIAEVITADAMTEEVTPEENEVRSSSSSPDCDMDNQSCSSDLGSTGIMIIDKVLKQHLKFCLRLTEYLGSIGPLKCKETSSVIKLEWQCGILEKLMELANAKQPPQTISKAYSPLAASGHDEILLFWAGNCGENPLFIHCNDFLQALKNQFHSEIEESYSRVTDQLYPVITTRILEENGSLLTPNIDEDSVISIYQFTDFFLLDHRWNLVQFVGDVADELLTCGRLMNTDKHVVLTQLQMYNKIPFKQSCCVTAARLLADPNPTIADAAGLYFETLLKDVNRKAQAVSYCTEALEDGDESLRIGACTALGRLQGEEVGEQLLFLAKCDTDQVKKAAELSISTLGAHFKPSDDEKNAIIWQQTTVMSDMSKSTDF